MARSGVDERRLRTLPFLHSSLIRLSLRFIPFRAFFWNGYPVNVIDQVNRPVHKAKDMLWEGGRRRPLADHIKVTPELDVGINYYEEDV